MNLANLSDKKLHGQIKSLVKKEREIVTGLLHHLREFDRRKLYAEYKCKSLFDYCIRELGYSESSAFRRIQAARLIEAVPEAEKQIQDGDLNLSNATMLMKFFKVEKIEDKSEKLAILEQVKGLSKRECEQKLFEITGKKLEKSDSYERLDKDHIRISMKISDATMRKLDRLRDFLGGEASFDELLTFCLDEAIQKCEKKQFKLSEKPQESKINPDNRVPSSSQKRIVYLRDDKKCQKCGSTHLLQFDHIKPWALDGKTEEKNLRLLCFNCNQRERIKVGLSYYPPREAS